MGIGDDFGIAFAKSQLGTNVPLPKQGNVFVSVKDKDKSHIIESVRVLENLGFQILATGGTQRSIENGISVERVNKVLEGRPHVVDSMNNNNINLLLIQQKEAKHYQIANHSGKPLRNRILLHNIIRRISSGQLSKDINGLGEIKSLQEYF